MDVMEIGWTGKASLGSIIIVEWRLEACMEEAGWTGKIGLGRGNSPTVKAERATG